MPLSIAERPSENVAIEVLHRAMDAGVRLIDTADVYCLDHRDIGHNERLIRHALRGWSGDVSSIIVATKGGLVRPDGRWERDARPASLRAACEESLRALDTDAIDLYQLHAPDPTVDFADSVGMLADLQSEGKIRWIGLSNVSVQEIDLARRIVPIVTVQNRLSPFFREALRDGVVDHCRDIGLGFLAYSPVGGGRLNKKLPSHPTVRDIADAVAATAHEVVLAWVLSKGENVIAIPGARTVAHAMSSIRAGTLHLTEADLQRIDQAHFSID